VQDSNLRRLSPTDLQSAPIGRSGNLPHPLDGPAHATSPQTPSRTDPDASRHNGAMADNSFDIVSEVDHQEVDNALQQTAKELAQRFDFKNTGATITWSGEMGVELEAETEDRVKAALDVFKDKLVKRGISLKALEAGEARVSGKIHKITCTLKAGISQEQAKKLGKIIRDEGPKKVKVQVQGDELRVSSPSRDDLQTVIALVKDADLDFPVQFTNYR
jgi:cyclic-di-GMP-binding protein